jgi:hypothetical protein
MPWSMIRHRFGWRLIADDGDDLSNGGDNWPRDLGQKNLLACRSGPKVVDMAVIWSDDEAEIGPNGWLSRNLPNEEVVVVWPMDVVNCWPIADEAKIWLNVVEAEIWPNGSVVKCWPNGCVAECWPIDDVAKSWPNEVVVKSWPNVVVAESWPIVVVAECLPKDIVAWNWPIEVAAKRWPNDE